MTTQRAIQGNTRIYKFNELADMRALSGQWLSEGDVAVFTGTQTGDGTDRIYTWNTTSTETDNGDSVVKLTDTTTGRFIAMPMDFCVNVCGYGADPTGTNDSTSAINAAAERVRDLTSRYLAVDSNSTTSPHNVLGAVLKFPPGIYRCDGNVWLGSDGDYNDQVKNIEAFGAAIKSRNTDGVAVDMSGAYGCRVLGLEIWGDETNTPDIGLLCARDSAGNSAGKHRFIGTKIMGEWDQYGYVNYGSEVNRWTNCEFRNNHAGSLGSIYLTGSNALGAASPNITIATGYQSSYSDFFNCCDIHFDVDGNGGTGIFDATNAAVIVENVDYGPKLYQCYLDTLQSATQRTALFRFRADAAVSSAQKTTESPTLFGCVLEADYGCVFYYEPTAKVVNPTIRDCVFSEAAPVADIIVAAGADVRRYDVQRFKEVLNRQITVLNLGTYKESVQFSGYQPIDSGADYYKTHSDIAQDGLWYSVNASDDLGLPEKPTSVKLSARAKASGSIGDSTRLEARADSNTGGSESLRLIPQVANVFIHGDDEIELSECRAGKVSGPRTGTHDGADDAATLTDSTQSWTDDEWIGETIYNITDGSSGTITDNDATTITATLSGGTDDNWDSSGGAGGPDYYVIGADKMNDSGASWTTDAFVGRTIKNLTDGSSGVITANSGTEITATLSGGTNDLWSDGDNYEIYHISGTHTGSSGEATVLTDSNANFGNSNSLRGFKITNDTDGSFGIIESNDATTITVNQLVGGTDNDFDNGDAYTVIGTEAGFFQIRAEANISAFGIKVKGYTM